jgi:hypothetical protein
MKVLTINEYLDPVRPLGKECLAQLRSDEYSLDHETDVLVGKRTLLPKGFVPSVIYKTHCMMLIETTTYSLLGT